MQTKRRRFLKLGLIGAIGLAAGGAVYRAVRGPAPLAPFALDGDASLVLGALIPALLAGMLPTEPAARGAAVAHTAERVKGAVRGLPLATQKEVQDLFGLLALAPARRFLAGVSGDWAGATPDQVGEFLQSWRHHRLATLQTAYLALHDLVLGAWYSDPASWPAIGYPGPIQELA
jgi:hypothetical protein